MPTRRRAAVVVAVALAASTALAACNPGVRPVARAAATSSPAPASLERTEWRLLEYDTSGSPVRVAGPYDLYFGGDDTFHADVCNSVSGTVVLAADHVVFAGTRTTTQMKCHGERSDVEQAFHAVAAGRVEWEVRDSTLRLRGAGGTLTYEPLEPGAPDPEAYTLVDGVHHGWEYRALVTYEGDRLVGMVTQVREGKGRPWGTAANGAPAADGTGLWVLGALDVGTDRLVAGLAPHDAARVTHRATAGAPEVPLRLDRPRATRWQAFEGVVAEHTGDSVLTAYDSTGRVVATWGRR